ncbi:MAG TPA: hypothetical protein VF432_06645 [Thermoanaerobaculia bacterium]
MKRLPSILTLLALSLLAVPAPAATFGNGGPSTTNNDDSCDVAVLPAATLLLPFFQVDTEVPATGRTTLFTITNVTNLDRIARVTLWTDYGFPVISFNIFLTGYDVQAINLFDIIARGIIAPDGGTGTVIEDRGEFSDVNRSLDLSRCDRLPGQLDDSYINRMQSAFLEGRVNPIGTLPGCANVGGEHDFATGYATIDVVGNCGFLQPNETGYWTTDLRYDNVLTGDYQQVDSQQNYAQANPLVHIRAIPEGGTPASRTTGAENRTNFERTFYANYSTDTRSDARQPLPSTFGARWIQGGPLEFETFYKVWREVPTGTGATCASYGDNVMPAVDVVVFDENENFVARADNEPLPLGLAGTALLAIEDDSLPQMTNGALSGWTYFNLDSDAEDEEATQNWVVVSMRSQGRYSVDFDATAFGNGCSAPSGVSKATQQGGTTIGPAPNTNP